ncbi:hypothetical protein JCM30471_29350 [Desulfuromonas carbonis]|uniref:non-ribosomal peptide synthetase n=1 Tax=Desulfuromonas sp. DDH964 TaxID=1823759 RepID=UPI00078CC31A|nr:non-ribosomal peptide synthetase [Desulfuromonas sp. DDH964]AMV71114.1 AMP-binding protein [Desulfuromonas sp. DDH964]
MVSKENIQNLYVLTPLQEGILFHQLREGGRAYFEQARFRLQGVLEPELFRQAWERLAARHDILRTLFVHEKVPRPLQLVLRQAPLDFRFEDLSGLGTARAEERLAEERRADLARPFALPRRPPLRLALFRLGPECHEFLWSFHHILLDGWSLAVLQRDFEALYLELLAGREAQLPPARQFRHYVQWLESRDQQATLDYWRQTLAGYEELASCAATPFLATGYAGGEFELTLEPELGAELRALARSRGATLNSLFRALWALALGACDGREEVVFAATVSGRPPELPGCAEMVGLFINAVPVRALLAPEQTLGGLVDALHQEGARALPHHYASLAEIQAQTPLGAHLLDSLLVFENYPEGEPSRLPFRQVDFGVAEHTNYAVEVQIFPEPVLRLRLRYNRKACPAALPGALQQGLPLLAAALAREPELPLAELFERWRQAGLPRRRPLRLGVAASFTAEELEGYCVAQLRPFGVNAVLRFAGYNQVFTALNDPAGSLRHDCDVALLLARFEDALHDRPAEPEAALATFRQLLFQLLANWPGPAPLLVGLFPVDPALDPQLRQRLQELGSELAEHLAATPGCFPLDLRQSAVRFRVREVFDPSSAQEGHIPFSREFFAAIGSETARACLALAGHSFKVLVVDADNTLWGGICGEVGREGIDTGGGYRALQEFLLARHREGMLLALASKNQAADVLDILDHHPGMLLRREHFASWRIDWNDKPANLRAIAAELGLGSDSFIFLDDSPAECARMLHECPEVLTLQLPAAADRFAPFLDRLWATDKLLLTREDADRPARYQAEQQRRAAEQRCGRDEYLRELALELVLRPAHPAQSERIAQLTQRTNQFNLNLARRTPAQIAEFLAAPGQCGLTLEVNDRFGAYGLTGVVLMQRRADTAEIETWLLSCRVLGRGVEEGLLAALGDWCRTAGIATLGARFVPGPRNGQVADLLRRAGFSALPLEDGACHFSLPTSRLPALAAQLTLRWEEPCTTPEAPPRPLPPTPLQPPSELAADAPEQGESWEPPLLPAGVRHDAYYHPLALANAGQLVARLRWRRPNAAPSPYTPPQTSTEASVCAIFAELLNSPPLGRDDNFFAAGGHSLLAIRVLARLYRELGVQVEVATLFARPTARELAAWLDAAACAGFEPIPRTPAAADYPLSPAQRRLWVLDRLEPGNPAYNIFAVDRIDGPLAPAALQTAFAELVARHEILRTCYRERDGEPRQQVLEAVAFRVPLEDQPDEAAALERCRELALLPFALTDELPLRVRLLRLAPETHLLLFTLHHIAGDGWSLGVLLKEFLLLYRAACAGVPAELPPPALQYRDFAAWQNARLADGTLESARSYWRAQLADPPPALPLATDFPRPLRPDGRGGVIAATFDAALTRRLNDLAVAQGATLFMVLQALLRVLLYRYTMQREQIIGTVSAGRTHPELEEQVGFYVNTLALRETLAPEEDFLTLLQRVKTTTLVAFAHQDYPFDRLVDELRLPRDTARAPLFDVLLVLQNNEAPLFAVDGLRIAPLELPEQTSRFDLSFLFAPQGEELGLQINYASALFEAATVAALAGHLQQLARSLSAAPQEAVGRAQLLCGEERERLLALSRGPCRPLPEGLTVIDLIRDQARRRPQAPALIAGEEGWSYRELDQISDRMAATLVAGHGVTPGSRVALHCSRGPWTVLAALAVLKAAAVYLPIDARYPQERIALLARDAAPVLVIRCAETDAPPWPQSGPSVTARQLAEGDAAPLPRPPRPEEAAYVIYTSGSTGRPKGVVVPHRGILNLAREQGAAFGLEEDDRVLLFASPGFDASVSEIFVTLANGAALVCPVEADLRDRARLIALLHRQQVTVATFPPSYLAHFGVTDLAGLKTLVTAGESPRAQQVQEFAPRLRYLNAYGPTENTVCATLYPVAATQPIPEPLPIGRPIANVNCYLLDDQGELVPDGVVGELALGGSALADGYLGQAELTARAFAASPALPGERLYRSGDLARRGSDGELRFLGRRDDQVKVRGYRIELEEVRQALATHPQLRDAAVVPVGKAGIYSSLLAAYVAAEPAPGSAELRAFLAARLPAFMVPEQLLAVAQLPLNRHGKLDGTALLALAQPSAKVTAPPQTPAEKLVAASFARVLNCGAVDREGHFFDLGGNSLSALRLPDLLRPQFPTATVADLFLHPRVCALAAALQSGANHPESGVGTDVFLFPSIDSLFSPISARIAAALAPRRVLPLEFSPGGFAEYCETVVRDRMTLPEKTLFLGYSGGGNFAFEVARRLGARAPRALLLVDSWIFEEPPTPDDYLGWYRQLCREQGLTDDSERLAGYIATLPPCCEPEPVASDIILITSSDPEPANGRCHRRWSGKTRGDCQTLTGSGAHIDMFAPGHFQLNLQTAKGIIDGLFKV